MSRRLSRRRYAVMAPATSTQYLGVINGICWHPCIRVVAVFTHIGRLDVRSCFARCLSAVVAVETVPGNIHVIEVGG